MWFSWAVEKVIECEGGYVDHPDDPGGRTNFGISQQSYPHLDIKNLTKGAAIAIYHQDYWTPHNLDMIADRELVTDLFKFIVNIGSPRAITLLQSTYNRFSPDRIKADGILGPATATAINQFPNRRWLQAEFRLAMIEWYAEHSKSVFLKGLVRRVLGG